MGCKVCDVELTENDLFYCNSCEDVRRRWEVYCQENNIYKKHREYKMAGRKKKKWN
ncbi:hypothetical protein HON71_00845 [Candidatus Woesearchaeota archaeon]|jgi:hypothetical protein|nr:hypothetical protein [Candidatus Woesearchaeota archaeon]